MPGASCWWRRTAKGAYVSIDSAARANHCAHERLKIAGACLEDKTPLRAHAKMQRCSSIVASETRGLLRADLSGCGRATDQRVACTSSINQAKARLRHSTRDDRSSNGLSIFFSKRLRTCAQQLGAAMCSQNDTRFVKCHHCVNKLNFLPPGGVSQVELPTNMRVLPLPPSPVLNKQPRH